MTARKRPTVITHFTHVRHLPTIFEHDLLSDTAARTNGLITAEVGELRIKEQRRHQPVPYGGHVADYVPFYFAPRSPMMFSISRNNVPSYQGGTADLVYLVSTLEQLHESGRSLVITDRNAALNFAAFRAFDPQDSLDDGFIDWELMSAKYWGNTPDDQQRVERRAAEALAGDRVPLDSIIGLATQNDRVAEHVVELLKQHGSQLPVRVLPDWYF